MIILVNPELDIVGIDPFILFFRRSFPSVKVFIDDIDVASWFVGFVVNLFRLGADKHLTIGDFAFS